MISKLINTIQLGSYDFEVAVSKSRAGQNPIFNLLSQVQRPSAELDTRKANVKEIGIDLKSVVEKLQVRWALNENPIVRMTFGPDVERLLQFVDFPGFTKNNIIGVRLTKEDVNQSSGWIYGVTQYATPLFDESRKTVMVEGYGLLFEAIRRHESRNFKNLGAKDIISSIAKKYGLTFGTTGPVDDKIIVEAEQNSDDFNFMTSLANFLDAYWYIEENNLLLIDRDHMYNQTPSIGLVFAKIEEKNYDKFFPVQEIIPQLDGQSFEAGANLITARGIDLDTKEIVEKKFTPKVTRMGSLSMNSDQFRSDEGVTINGKVLRPAPKLKPLESGLFLPLYTRSSDELRYQNFIEKKDVEIRVLVRMPGIPALKPGMLVQLVEVGEILSGNYVVESITHSVEAEEGFTSELMIMRNAIGQINRAVPFKVNLKDTPDKLTTGTRKFATVVGD